MFESALLGVVAVVIIMAALYDVATLTIPNWLSLVLVGVFPVAALLAGFSWSDVALHLGLGAAALIAGAIVFALGYAGGGDAKLFAASALYMGLSGFWPFLMAVTLAGGGLAACILALRQVPLPVALAVQPWIARLYQKGQGVPYGVAIAAGALFILPQTKLALSLSL